MIVVKLELWPGGDRSRATEIGRTYVWREHLHSPGKADYEVRVCRRGHYEVASRAFLDSKGFTRTGRVENWPRLSYNVWRLICRCLKAAFPEENKKSNGCSTSR